MLSRQARERSPSGIYHIMTRGINKADLFHDNGDRYKYYEVIAEAKDKYPFALYAFCLMSNHVHLLLKETDIAVSEVMKSIGVRYSMYYNKKYERIGNLFQNRFRSEAIVSENHFLTCARYIHNNPVKAGLVSSPKAYRWSSYRSYLDLGKNDFLSKGFLLDIYSNDIPRLIEFTTAANEDRFMEYDIEDEQQEDEDNRDLYALETLMRQECGLELSEYQFLQAKARKAALRVIKARTDLSYRRVAELLNISKDIVYRA